MRLLSSAVLFPVSLIWYRRIIREDRASPLAYWLAVVLWWGAIVAAPVVLVHLIRSDIEESGFVD